MTRPRSPAATSTGPWSSRPRSHADGTGHLTDAMALGMRERGHDLGKARPGVLSAASECDEGTVALRHGVRAPARVRADPSPARRRSKAEWRGRGGADVWCCPRRSPPSSTGPRPRSIRTQGRRVGQVRAAPPARAGSLAPGLGPGGDPSGTWTGPSARGSAGPTLHQRVRGPVERPRVPQRAGAAGADLPAHGRDRAPPRPHRCPNAWAASGTGTTATRGSATRASPWTRCGSPPVPTRRSKFFAWMAGAAATADGARRGPADHVRGRRRARSQRTGAPAPVRMAEQPPGPGRQRRVEPAAARRLRGAAGRRRPAEGPARPIFPTTPAGS